MESVKNSSKLLLDEPPLVIQPALAQQIGLNEAIVLQQIHYWIKQAEESGRNLHDGYYWVYNSIRAWRGQFPFWGKNTLIRIFTSLEKKQLLIIGNFNKSPLDHTKWYRVDYSRLGMGKSITPKWVNRLGQDGYMHLPKMGTAIPETTTEITTDIKEPSVNGLLPQFQSLPYWKNEEEDAAWLVEFTGEFPEITAQNIIECRDFWDGRRARGKGDWKNRLRNWMKKGRQFAAERAAGQAEIERKRSSIPQQKKPGQIPSGEEVSEQVRRVKAGLSPE